MNKGVKGEDAIENIETKVINENFHAIVKLRKYPCKLDIFFIYLIIYYCVSKNDNCSEGKFLLFDFKRDWII